MQRAWAGCILRDGLNGRPVRRPGLVLVITAGQEPDRAGPPHSQHLAPHRGNDHGPTRMIRGNALFAPAINPEQKPHSGHHELARTPGKKHELPWERPAET
jgi:hypothetical protein